MDSSGPFSYILSILAHLNKNSTVGGADHPAWLARLWSDYLSVNFSLIKIFCLRYQMFYRLFIQMQKSLMSSQQCFVKSCLQLIHDPTTNQTSEQH